MLHSGNRGYILLLPYKNYIIFGDYLIMKLISTILSVLLILSLTGCGNSAHSSEQSAIIPAETASPVTAEASAPPIPSTLPSMPEDQQKQLILDRYEEWSYKEPWESPWFYTFTDLDHNGRLEVTAATVQGTGIYTHAGYWEVTPDYSDIRPCEITVDEEGASYPDIIVDSAPCCFDPSTGLYYYIFEDMVRGGFSEYYTSINAICLHDGKVDLIPLAARYECYDNSEKPTAIIYYDGDGNESTKQVFDSAVQNFSAGKETSTISLNWTMVENPTPKEEPSEWDGEVGPEVVITKNPRSETVPAGGKTWFIAHADNAVSLTWRCVDKDGFSVSLEDALAQHPGLTLEVLEDDTIAVGNIPLSFDGWGIQARFDGIGDGNFDVTEPAIITVQ